MQRKIGIGKQDFAALRENQCFYIDKTDFIKQWWESQDDAHSSRDQGGLEKH